MVKKCEDCSYYSKINEYATCHYSEATTNIHDDGIPCSLHTGKITTVYGEITDDVLDDPYPNETYDQWIARLKTYGVSETFTKTTNIIKEKEPEKPKSRFDDII
jgi:hypothetical protein